ncbi:hypothetical protein Tco_0441771 [Tanacetum coccineum]
MGHSKRLIGGTPCKALLDYTASGVYADQGTTDFRRWRWFMMLRIEISTGVELFAAWKSPVTARERHLTSSRKEEEGCCVTDAGCWHEHMMNVEAGCRVGLETLRGDAEACFTTNFARIPSSSGSGQPRVTNRVLLRGTLHERLFMIMIIRWEGVKTCMTEGCPPMSWERAVNGNPGNLLLLQHSKLYHIDFSVRWFITSVHWSLMLGSNNTSDRTKASLSQAKVRMRTEFYLSERRRLESECEKQADLLKVRDAKIESLIEPVTNKNANSLEYEKGSLDWEGQRNFYIRFLPRILITLWNCAMLVPLCLLSGLRSGFVDQVHELETTCSGLRGQVSGYERLKEHIEEFQDSQMNIVNDKVAKLDADLLEMALHLEEIFYPHLLNTISDWRWLLTHGLKLAIVKCLNSQEYLSALGAALSVPSRRECRDGLS